MQLASHIEQPQGDEAWQRRERARRIRQWIWQILLLIVIAAVFWYLAGNVHSNLEQRHIRSGFEFLHSAANFNISESVIPFASGDSFVRAFAAAISNTLSVSFFAILSATVLGVVIGLMRLAAHPVLKGLGTAHVEFYRNIPLIIQLFAIYSVITMLLPDSTDALHFGSWALLSKAGLQYAHPVLDWKAVGLSLVVFVVVLLLVRRTVQKQSTNLMGWIAGLGAGALAGFAAWIVCGFLGGWSKPELSGFAIEGGSALSPEFLALWLGLTLFTSAAIAEIVRAGFQAVPIGQWYAGLALGMSKLEVVSYVTFPQAMRLAIPPLASQYMNLIKNSSLAVVIGYPDVVAVGNASINITGQALEVIVLIMAVYLVINLIASVVMNMINARVMRAVG